MPGRLAAHDTTTRRSVTPGGVVVVSEDDQTALSVSLGAWVGAGSRDESADEAGVAHFLEHLLFKGTRQHDSRWLNRAIERLGGDLNAYTSKEHTGFTAHAPASTAAESRDLLFELLTAPLLDRDEVDGERAVILEELAAAEDAPDDVIFTELYRMAFDDHPLGRDVLGVAATIDALGHRQIADFYDRWYRPGNIVVAAVGAVDHDDLVEAVGEWFDGRASGEPPTRSLPAQPRRDRAVVERPLEQVHRCWGWRGLPVRHPDRFALAVVNHALGGGVSSRLFYEVREQRALAYSVYSGIQSFSDSGLVSVYAASGPDNADELDEVVDSIIDDMCRGVTSDELDVAKGSLWGSTILALDDPDARMSRLAMGEMNGHGPEPLDQVASAIASVTVEDTARVAESIFRSPRVDVVVGPER